jgi:hypothetical protein
LVRNGSKKAVLEVIGFLFVSLGSSTLQLHDSSGIKRHAHLASVVKMATALEKSTTEEQRSAV